MAPLCASALDGVPVAIDGAAVATGSAVHEDLDVFLGRELSCQVFAQAGLVARHDEVVSGHNGHSSIFHETVLRVKVGGAGRGRAGLSGPFWKDDGGCRACPEPARRSEEHTSELQSRPHLVCRLLLEKKKKHKNNQINQIKKNTGTRQKQNNKQD